MSQVKKESQVIPEGSGRVISMHDLVDQHAPRSEELKVVDSSNQQDVGFNIVDSLNNDSHAKLVEELAQRMRTPGNIETFAISYSVLRDENGLNQMEYAHWKYYVMWLPMMLIALYMMLKVGLYRFIFVPIRTVLTKKRTSKERLLLGPEKGTVFFDVFDDVGNLLHNGVTTSIALDVAYNLRKLRPKIKSVGAFLCDFWLNQPDGHGLRNRIKIIYKRMLQEVNLRLEDGKQVRLLGLASGSAQANIEVMANLKDRGKGHLLATTIVDLNQTSLHMARRLAESRGVMDSLDIKLENIKTYLANQDSNSWDIVEMVGFLDYRNDTSVIEICKEIRRVLKPEGVFLTSSISPSLWSFPVRWVVNWPLLIRRSKSEFEKLLRNAWNESDRFELRYVPTKTHVVAILTKNS